MKNFVVLSIVLSISFVSCEKGKNSLESSNGADTEVLNASENLAVDSIEINDSLRVDKNLTAGFQSKILLFPTLRNKALLDSIYSPKDIRLEEYSKANLSAALNSKKTAYYEEQKEMLKEYTPGFAQNWNNHSDMKVISNENQFLTLQYTGDGYTGGAHGYYFENYKVFDLKNNKTVQLTDVVSNQDSILWDKILMDNFLKNDSENGQAEMLLVDQIPLNNNFYFDKENLYFLYNQYEITAYAAGPVLIKVPLSDIKPLLTDEFKSRQGL